MAGRPGRRGRLAAAAREASGEPPRPPLKLPPKPPEDVSEAEKRAYYDQVRRILRTELRELRRPRREADLRAGQVQPRNRAEIELFGADLIDRHLDDGQDPDA
jgi:hypothetical protein